VALQGRTIRTSRSPIAGRRLLEDAMPDLAKADCINENCPWSGKPVAADSLTEYAGEVVGFCNPGCRDKFEAAIRHFEAARVSDAAPTHSARQP